jgi:hypothetical protein
MIWQIHKRLNDAPIFRAATKLASNPAPIDRKFIYSQASRRQPENLSKLLKIPARTGWITGHRSA